MNDLKKYSLGYVPPVHIEFTDTDEGHTMVKDLDGEFYKVEDVDNRKCKNCKYWGEPFDGMCDWSESFPPSDESESHAFDIEVTALDDQGLEVNIKTGPEFGCIHFKQK